MKHELLLSSLLFASSACGLPAKDGTAKSSEAQLDQNALSNTQHANCNKGTTEFQMEKDWYKHEINPSANLNICYLTPTPERGEGKMPLVITISKIDVPPPLNAGNYAKSLATENRPGRLPIAGSYQERKINDLEIYQVDSTETDFNRLSGKRELFIRNGSTVYRISFISPKPDFADDFNKFGKPFFDSLRVSGKPIK